jgi:hypothetical protein
VSEPAAERSPSASGEAGATTGDLVPPAAPLAYATSIDYPPGSNLKGRLAGATWTWLLPTPALEGVTVADDPAAAARAGSTGLAVYDGPAARLRGAVERGGLGPATAYAVRPARGQLRSAVPLGDGEAAAWLAGRGLLGPTVVVTGDRRGRAAKVGRRLRTGIAARRATERAVALFGPEAPGPGAPEYLRAIAASAGLELSGWRFALAAPGDYNTQKLLLWLWPPDAVEPTVVVKATRDAVAAPRLENERLALERLAALDDLTAGHTPRVRFAGRIDERSLVGEEVLDGRSLRALQALSAADRRVTDALDWLGALAASTARPADPERVAAALADLARRWTAATKPSPALAARIASDIAAVRVAREPIPLVYQHGDPGTWNLFAGSDGRTRFLDWENFDPGGLPLWDPLYLLRSVVGDAMGHGPLRGLARGGRAAGVARRFAAALHSDPAVRDAIARYCALVGVRRDLVAPLARLGWMHQALKESTRLPAGMGDRAPSQATLRATLGS